ncbi:lysophospholipid transporter LplT [Derxia gummosa]|uniref:Lysophospholipid transporter LplT n=1 Tax=Derxia gummosa DSM 723 TaxID=1121388 RepID=A0A8B6X3U6_9BURK|nr:lysophospholipid transporter LplT [Derxia gummosa]
MKRGFYTIMAAQFCSSLADNALLIAAIALLREAESPDWMTPLLKFCFVLSYVLLAAFVGAFADSRPKGRVMLWTNMIKIAGCATMFFGAHPLAAYAIVGLGAAAYSPAKYGILTELLPPEKLVAANGWIEGTTVTSIILGVVLGGALVSVKISTLLLALDLPGVDTGIDSPAESAICVVALIYLAAAAINFGIPDTGARYPQQHTHPLKLIREFAHCNRVLWSDRLGQISLAVTTLFWAAGATLQFIVLAWAEWALQLDLSRGAMLQSVVAVGIALGAAWAAARVPLRKSLCVLPVGMAMGFCVIALSMINRDILPSGGITVGGVTIEWAMLIACGLLLLVGVMAGYFVVPMNALLQHRGHVLMSAGHSIAVQNFNENLGVLVMLCVYAGLVKLDLPVTFIITAFGLFVAATMQTVIRRHKQNQREHDAMALIPDGHH